MKIDYLNTLFHFVLITSNKYKIDESHSIKHSFDVYKWANDIYTFEREADKTIIPYEKVILSSAILHDMCDKKYMNETEGIVSIKDFMKDKMTEPELDTMINIISTMSYSKVKRNGFPDLGEAQKAYHIVREADLLSAYDFDRCLLYGMHCYKMNFEDAYKDSIKLFENRVLKHIDDKLFTSPFSLQKAEVLHKNALKQISRWRKFIRK